MTASPVPQSEVVAVPVVNDIDVLPLCLGGLSEVKLIASLTPQKGGICQKP